jgi:Fe-S-cluster containining protein
VAFECFQCGECCSQLGLVYSVTRTYGNYRFLIYNQYTGEEIPVEVDPDKREIFEDKSIFETLPGTCPFFRRQPGTGLAYCTVHRTRPEICRNYGCWRLLVINPRGRRVGRIEYIRTLRSDDRYLTDLWDRCIENDQEPDDAAWESRMIRILARHGFTVRK